MSRRRRRGGLGAVISKRVCAPISSRSLHARISSCPVRAAAVVVDPPSAVNSDRNGRCLRVHGVDGARDGRGEILAHSAGGAYAVPARCGATGQRRRRHLDGLGIATGPSASRMLRRLTSSAPQRARSPRAARGRQFAGEGVKSPGRLDRVTGRAADRSARARAAPATGVRKQGCHRRGGPWRAGSCWPCCQLGDPPARTPRGSGRRSAPRACGREPRGAGGSARSRAPGARPSRPVDVMVELAGAGDPPSMSRAYSRPHHDGHVAQERADAVVDDADLVRRGAVAQWRPHEQVHEQADRDARCPYRAARDEHAAVVAVARVSTTKRWRPPSSSRRAARARSRRSGPPADEAERERV